MAVKHEGVAEYGEAGDGGVGVDDVKGGVGEVGGAEIVVELVAAGGSLNPGGDEARVQSSEFKLAKDTRQAGWESPISRSQRAG